MLGLTRGSWAARFSVFLTMVSLVAGMAGCVSSPTEYDLTISSTEGGDVTSPGEGTHTYEAGTAVNLTAIPATGYRFVNWIGNVSTIGDVNAASTTITMNGDYSITADFEKIQVTSYALTITVNGSGSTSPSVGQHTYGAGTVVPIIATPASGYGFVNWTGNVGTIANVNAPSTNITMNQDCSIMANFEEGATVTFADPNLEAAIREAIHIPAGPIYASELIGLISFSASGRNISSLAGLEHCINLTHLDLSNNRIANIASVANLTNMAYLQLDLNEISEANPLVQNEGLGEGDAVYLRGNPLSWNAINSHIPELRRRGVTVVYDERGITGNVTVVPNCERMTAEYTITFDVHASLTSGVHSITIWFPDGTAVPQTGWQTGDISVNGQDVFGVDVTVVGTRVTFFVPQPVMPGTVTVVFKEDACIVNPPAGSYYLYVNTSRAPDSTPMRLGPY